MARKDVKSVRNFDWKIRTDEAYALVDGRVMLNSAEMAVSRRGPDTMERLHKTMR
jgi:hypothetical protein